MGKTIYEELIPAIAGCTADIVSVETGGVLGLDTQIKAYDLMNRLYELEEILEADPVLKEVASAYCDAFRRNCNLPGFYFDVEQVKKDAEDRIRPFQEKLNNARFEAAAAASLHEFAKEVFQTWQTEGIFARRRALRELRERAGFRLESHRIGNYVAKTFDLMNEAQVRFAGAQQALFAADIRYKICPGTYGKIYEILCDFADL